MNDVALFESFFRQFEAQAYQYSIQDRAGGEDLSLTFGQIDAASWKQILELCHAGPTTNLIDLGSGAAKAVLSAAYFFPGLQAKGVEILPNLHQWACHIHEQFCKQLSEQAGSRVKLECTDMFHTELKDADIVLVNSTCMDDALILKMSLLLQAMKAGAKAISIGRPLKADFLKRFACGAWRMGWQPEGQKSPVFIYDKLIERGQPNKNI